MNIQRLVGYVGEDDIHLPVLTVRETLELAFKTLNVDLEHLESDEAEQYISTRVNQVIQELHLTNAADTIIGNELLRGVSGGEKKRVTFAEMYMGAYRMLLLDKISVGLDSAVTIDICRYARLLAKTWRTSIVSSLLAPPPEAYQCFSHLMLMRDGKVLYHGRRDGVEGYLNSLGLTVPVDEDIADFLQSFVSSPLETYLKQKTDGLLLRHASKLKDLAQQLEQGKTPAQVLEGTGIAPVETTGGSTASVSGIVASETEPTASASPAAAAAPGNGRTSEEEDDDISNTAAWKAAASFAYLEYKDLPFLPASVKGDTSSTPGHLPISVLCAAGTAQDDDDESTSDNSQEEDEPSADHHLQQVGGLLLSALRDAAKFGGEAASASGITESFARHVRTPDAALTKLRAVYAALQDGGSSAPKALSANVEGTDAAASVCARVQLVQESCFGILETDGAVFTTQGLFDHWTKYNKQLGVLNAALTKQHKATGGDSKNNAVTTTSSDLETLTITDTTNVLDCDLRPDGTVRPWSKAQLADLQADKDAPAGAVAVSVKSTPSGGHPTSPLAAEESGTGVAPSVVDDSSRPQGMDRNASTGGEIEEDAMEKGIDFKQKVDEDRLRRQTSANYALKTPFTQRQYGNNYSLGFFAQLKLLLGRELKLTLRDTVALRARFIQAIVMAVVVGTTYLQLEETEFQVMLGAIFFTATLVAFVNIASIEPVNFARAVVAKHRDALMYSPSTYVAASVLNSVPVSGLEAMIFSGIVYFLVGLNASAERFFAFALVVFAASLAFSSLFRLVGSAIPNLQAAQAAGGPLTGLMSVLAGFLVTNEQMPVWLGWLTYISPFYWIVRALSLLEFSSEDYDFEAQPGQGRFGDVVLNTFDIPTDFINYWYAVIFLFGWWLVFAAFGALALTYTPSASTGGRSVHLEDKEAAERAEIEAVLEERDEVLAHQLASRVKRMEKTLKSRETSAVASGELSRGESAAATLAAQSSTAAVGMLAEKTFDPPIDFPRMTMAWRDVDYTVTLPDGSPKQLLHGLQGFAKPYSMVCLMGASGAGKTTLLDVLAQRKNTGEMGGSISVNGVDVSKVNLPRVTGYCEQMDNHMPFATVREAIRTSARLRLPASVSDEKVEEFTQNILEVLDLAESAERYVGVAGVPGGLPAGERKRLTIGVELAANPSILFLDEPTSGLDSRSAAMVVKVLRRVASQGRSIVCTVHQPSAALFYEFDALLLLKRGGQQIYFGPLGYRGATFTAYMKSVPGTLPLPPRTNVADWMLRVLQQRSTKDGRELLRVAENDTTMQQTSGNADKSPAAVAPSDGCSAAAKSVMSHEIGVSRENKMKDHGVVAAQWYRSSALWAATDGEAARLTESSAGKEEGVTAPPTKTGVEGRYMTSFWTQTKLVVGRQAKNAVRNPEYALLRSRILFILGLVFGFVFSEVDVGTQAGANSITGVIFTAALFVGVVGMMTAFATLAMERPAVYRETAVNMYHPAIYSFAQVALEVPIVTVGANVFLIIFFNLVDFPNKSVGIYFFVFLIVFEIALFFVTFGQMLAAVTPTPQVAQIIAGGTVSLFFLFSGFLAPLSQVPGWFIWIYYINPVQYGVEALVTTVTRCEDVATCVKTTVFTASGAVQVPLGDFVESFYDFKYDDRVGDVFILLAFIALALLVKMYVQSKVRFESR